MVEFQLAFGIDQIFKTKHLLSEIQAIYFLLIPHRVQLFKMQKLSIKKIILPGAIFLLISFACREKAKIVLYPIPKGEMVE